MSHLEIVEPQKASEQVRALYLDFQRRMGFPSAPNFIMVQGHSLAAASGTWGLVQNTLVGGSLPRTLKEMVFAAISADRKCRYCEAAHLACCRMLGVDEVTLEKLSTNVEDVDPVKARDIIKFGIKCARDPQALTKFDFDHLRSHGLRESEIMELISMSALAVYANIVADATAVPPDEMFGRP
ncbi:carboxymuconolactone decarboxylase family protein [Variovorax sp. J22R133]|uniref:carboxymuconolactone decarboxylase family protein n=1 Tax=Variovorax brevis TaxID=3053503 RepID=UPI0025758D41|nr:carboxymuconolactone decarboxylase family protein [Variovorax sp. J22R133]MDM0117121.1 carboxymuconolactone decarboxylase family protein [Variovorax sp. J22R133]